MRIKCEDYFGEQYDLDIKDIEYIGPCDFQDIVIKLKNGKCQTVFGRVYFYGKISFIADSNDNKN